MSKDEPTFLLVDACVLIDYLEADPSVLGLISRHVGSLHATPEVLKEVRQVQEISLEDVGILEVEPNLEMRIQAANMKGVLSINDCLCFFMARAYGWVLLTNDRALREHCTKNGVSVLWGLEPMKTLVRKGKLGVCEAERVAEQVHKSNPFFITTKIVKKFVREVRRLE